MYSRRGQINKNTKRVKGVMPEIQQSRRSKGRWYILLLISLMYLITYLDRVNISTAAPVISKEYGFDKVTMGAIFSAFVWAYAMFQVPGGWFGDRFGPRRILTTIVSYWSVMTAATAMATSAMTFIVVRFLFGVGEAGAFPVATRAMQLCIRARSAVSCKALHTVPAALVPRSRHPSLSPSCRRWDGSGCSISAVR